jgi:MFS transporter, MHS family, proline/betaine transporter
VHRVLDLKDDAVNTQSPRARQVVAAVIGNALEWYDFIVFGFVSVVISRLFFPASNEYTALLLTFATFGVGFFMRPVGAIVLGMYADRAGRKSGLQLVMFLMTVAVALIAFAPTYASIGIGAPILIVLARLLQGFATGGEFSSATSFLVESAPARRRGFFGSLQMVGQGLGVLLGALAGVILTRALAAEQLHAWGWRLPFLFGLLIGPVGFYIRRHLEETNEFRALRSSSPPSMALSMLLRTHARALSASFLLVICATSAPYVEILYMPTYAKTQLALPLPDAFTAQMLALAWMILLIPLFGILSDRIGRRPVLIAATLSHFLLPYPLLAWLQAEPSFLRLLGVQVAMCSMLAVLFGPFSTALAEQFPAGVRSTGMAIAYNLAVTLFGGFAPFTLTWLIRATGSGSSPAFYLMFAAAVGIGGTLLLREGRRPVSIGAASLPGVVVSDS